MSSDRGGVTTNARAFCKKTESFGNIGEREHGGVVQAFNLRIVFKSRLCSSLLSRASRASSTHARNHPSRAFGRGNVGTQTSPETETSNDKKTVSSPLSPRYRGFLRGTRVPFRSVSVLAGGGVSTCVPGDVQERLAAFPERRPHRTRRLLRRRAVPFRGEDFGRFGREAYLFFFLRRRLFAVAPESDGFGTRHRSRLFTRRGPSLFGNEKRWRDAIAFRRRREREGVHRGRRRRRRRRRERRDARTFLFAKKKGNVFRGRVVIRETHRVRV